MENINWAEHDRKRKEDREKLIEELGLKEADIFEDDKGEYYMQEPSMMDEGENESGAYKKVYLE